MRQWLSDIWTDSTIFRATLRGLGVTLGTGILVAAGDLATWSGAPVAVVQVAGVLLTGGSTAIPAGERNPVRG